MSYITIEALNNETEYIVGDFTAGIPRKLPYIIKTNIIFCSYKYINKDKTYTYDKNTPYYITNDGNIYNYIILHNLTQSHITYSSNYAQQAILMNNAEAMYSLSKISSTEKEKYIYLKMAADNRHTKACYELGCYEGISCENAIKYLLIAAKKGHIESTYMLCVRYNEKNNIKNAFNCAIYALKNKYIEPINYLIEYNILHQNYYYVKKYFNILINFVEKRLVQSHKINKYGNYYQNIEYNYEQMIKIYNIAIDNNDAVASNELGTYYKNCEDYENFVNYMIITHELNRTMYAAFKLGLYYKYVNESEMIRWFNESVEKEHCIIAMYMLAKYYYDKKMYIDFINNANKFIFYFDSPYELRDDDEYMALHDVTFMLARCYHNTIAELTIPEFKFANLKKAKKYYNKYISYTNIDEDLYNIAINAIEDINLNLEYLHIFNIAENSDDD